MIKNIEEKITKNQLTCIKEIPEFLKNKYGETLLRWYISNVSDEAWDIEGTILELPLTPSSFPKKISNPNNARIAVNLIPTGIACSVGGYAGDASPTCKLLASAVDYLVTNPNSLNASNFFRYDPSIIYTEGYSLNHFCSGDIDLSVPISNRIGVILEKGDKSTIKSALHIIDTVRSVYGVDISAVEFIPPIDVRFSQSRRGVATGTIGNPNALLAGAENLLKQGVTAIAVASHINNLAENDYIEHFSGNFPNPVGGVEAIISHMISHLFNVPCAHAPIKNFHPKSLEEQTIDPRAAGEYASSCGLACVLMGLQNAPQWDASNIPINQLLSSKQIMAIIAPATALGNIAVIKALESNIPIIAVEENTTLLNIDKNKMNSKEVISVKNYFEATGVLMALNNAISLDSIYRPMHSIIEKYSKEIK